MDAYRFLSQNEADDPIEGEEEPAIEKPQEDLDDPLGDNAEETADGTDTSDDY